MSRPGKLATVRRSEAGLTIIEVVFACMLMAIMCLGFTELTVSLIRLNDMTTKRAAAITFIQDMLEQLKGRVAAGEVPTTASDVPTTGFTRTWTVQPAPANPGFLRFDVTVAWNDGQPRQLTLTSAVNR